MNQNTINIKGTKNGLVILLEANHRFEEIKQQLQKKMESSRGFFTGAKCTLYSKDKELVPDQQLELEAICREYGLNPDSGPSVSDLDPIFSPKKYSMPGEPALLLNKTLRSGQKITHPTNIVILGDVHRGAKINAGENILVMGNCYGTTNAGISGDKTATITAFHLHPQGMSIAGIIFDGQYPVPAQRTPHKAKISRDNIIIKNK
ncbi:MAG: septum site-determining protein MinC [Clostridiales bacterium]|nr:septum site-determining protein MinC [Clostridiales bacterium]MCF8023259.1 septum site-determining protein MinC [Clostridiales bacterium]